MTVGTQMHQCLNSIEAAKVQLKNFSLETQDQNAKTHFSDLANQLESIEQSLKDRVNYIEEQETQYNVYNQNNE